MTEWVAIGNLDTKSDFWDNVIRDIWTKRQKILDKRKLAPWHLCESQNWLSVWIVRKNWQECRVENALLNDEAFQSLLHFEITVQWYLRIHIVVSLPRKDFSPQFASWIFPGGDLAGREGDFCFSSFYSFLFFLFFLVFLHCDSLLPGSLLGGFGRQREREIWEESRSNKSKCTSNNFFCSHIFFLFRRIS